MGEQTSKLTTSLGKFGPSQAFKFKGNRIFLKSGLINNGASASMDIYKYIVQFTSCTATTFT